MKNIGIPGILPFTIACMLLLIALRAHALGKQSEDKRYAASKIISVAGVFIFALLAVFEIIEAGGLLR